MSTIQLPTSKQAHATVVGIHNQAYLGRLAQHGEVPQTEKEAHALLALGTDLLEEEPADGVKTAGFGDGVYAQAKAAFDHYRSTNTEIAPGFSKAANIMETAPGFSKAANESFASNLPELDTGLIDAAYAAAYDLSLDPAVYGAALVKRAENEAMLTKLAEQQAATAAA